MPQSRNNPSLSSGVEWETPEQVRLAEIREYVGNRIREERKQQDISQELLAEWAGTSLDTIKRMEKGDLKRFDVLYLISEVLRVPVHKFFPSQEQEDDVRIQLQTAIQTLQKISEKLN